MGLAEIRPFFRDRLEALGYHEHDQPFEPGEIGSNITDGAFHLEIGTIPAGPANQLAHSYDYPITVRIYKQGFSNIIEAYDAVMEEADNILADFLNPTVRLKQTILKDIVPNSIQPVPLNATNDNVIVLNLVFTARLELCYKT